MVYNHRGDTLEGNDLLGRVVQSTAGRDGGKLFVVINILDGKYVLISDGKLRTNEKPKKKKVKHLLFKSAVFDDLKYLILENKQISNSMIRKFLQLNDVDKEV